MISASIVTYHTDIEIVKRLLSLIEKSPINHVYLIDNSASDEIKQLCDDYNKCSYHRTPENLGYGKAHNIALSLSIKDGFKYHFILNPDIYWNSDIVTPIVKFLEENDNVGQLMPKILYPSGNTQYLCKLLPSPSDLILRRFFPIKKMMEKHQMKYEMRWTDYDTIMEVPALSGCFMVLRNSVIQKIGGFDERYFIYGEDVDLCRRIGQVAKTVYFPHVSVFHLYKRGSYESRKLMWLHIRSMIKYFNKWGWFFDRERKTRNAKCINQIPPTSNP